MNSSDNSLLMGLPAAMVIFLGFAAFTLYMALKGLICYLIVRALARIPAEHRTIQPAMVWLLLVPCFSVIWNFVVFRKVPESFKIHFEASSVDGVSDCGKRLGLAYSVLALTSLIPWLGLVTLIPSWILLVLCLSKFNWLKSRVRLSAV